MHTKTPQPETLQVWPENWLEAQDLSAWWPEHNGPLYVDLGAGKGRFLKAHAARNPDTRFLGIERKLVRVRKMDRAARRNQLDHVRFLRCEGYYAVRYLLPPASVDVMYIYYPDPWPKAKHHRHRILAPRFMDALADIMKPGGIVQFATDHKPYFDEVTELWTAENRFEPTDIYLPEDDEISDFELMFREDRPANRAALRRKVGTE